MARQRATSSIVAARAMMVLPIKSRMVALIARQWLTGQSGSEMKADAALTKGAFGSQPRQKLGLRGGELLRRDNALLLQFG